MKIENAIGWCDETGNAVIGCDRVSPGCKNCYAAESTPARVLRHRGIETWGSGGVRHPVQSFAEKARRLNRLCVCDDCHDAFAIELLGKICDCGGPIRRIRLFADSNSDFLDRRWSIETLAGYLDTIRQCENVDFLLLTKRPKLFIPRVKDARNYHTTRNADLALWLHNWLPHPETPGFPAKPGSPPRNIWIGTSVEDEPRQNRIDHLLAIPAPVHFLSIEPILEVMNFDSWFTGPINWVIVGGESGQNRREAKGGTVEAICNVADQCRGAGVPCYVKQDCARLPGQQGRIPDEYWKLKEMPRP